MKAGEGPEATPLIEEVDSEAPVTARAVEEKDEDEEEGERRMEVEEGEEPVSVEGEAAGEVEEEREEDGQGQRGGEVEAGPDQEWEEQQPNGRPEPVADQEVRGISPVDQWQRRRYLGRSVLHRVALSKLRLSPFRTRLGQVGPKGKPLHWSLRGLHCSHVPQHYPGEGHTGAAHFTSREVRA